jgi:hypothetical protein
MTSSTARRTRLGSSVLLIGVLALTGEAGATLRVESHNDPAGDPTAVTYVLDSPAWTREPIQFSLGDGEDRSFGPKEGTYTVQAAPPAGWKVIDIQCVGHGDAGEFVIDVPGGLVTIAHGADYEQTCAFTNGKADASGPPSSGVAPSPPEEELADVRIPREVALLGVRTGRGFAEARLRLIRRSTIGLRLHRGGRVLARKRVSRRAGERVARLWLPPRTRRWFSDHGRKRVEMRLRIRVADRQGNRKVFWYSVIVPV